MHSGPPFANGSAHLGHFLNMVGKDAINRYKMMQGYRVHMLPGFDCYGIAIEDQALVHNVHDSLPTSLRDRGERRPVDIKNDNQYILEQR